jgi:phage tail-like protein
MPYLGHAFGGNKISINEAPPTGCYFEVTIFPGYMNAAKIAKMFTLASTSELGSYYRILLGIVAGLSTITYVGNAVSSQILAGNVDVGFGETPAAIGALAGVNPLDFRFHRVTGLESKIETDDIRAGGVNTEMLQLPSRVVHGNLVLERGLFFGSPLTLEFNLAMSLFQMIPGEILVTLQRPDKIPIAAWLFRDAYPVDWSNSDLWSDDNNISMEKMEFAYSRMHPLRI